MEIIKSYSVSTEKCKETKKTKYLLNIHCKDGKKEYTKYRPITKEEFEQMSVIFSKPMEKKKRVKKEKPIPALFQDEQKQAA